MSNVDVWVAALADNSKKNKKNLLSALQSLYRHQAVVPAAYQHLGKLCCSADRQVSFGATSLLASYSFAPDVVHTELKPVIENLIAQMKSSSLGLRLRCIHLLGLVVSLDSPMYDTVSAALLAFLETCIGRKTNKSTAISVSIQTSCVMVALEAIGARELISLPMLDHCLKSSDVTTVSIALRLLDLRKSEPGFGDVAAVMISYLPLVQSFYKPQPKCLFAIDEPMSRVHLANLCNHMIAQHKDLCSKALYLLVNDTETPVWTVALTSLAKKLPWEVWAVGVYSSVEKSCLSAMENGSTSEIHSVLSCVRHMGHSWISTGKRGTSSSSPLATLVPSSLLASPSVGVREAALMAMIWIYPVSQSSVILEPLRKELGQQIMSVTSVQRLFQQLIERAQINRGFFKMVVKALLSCYQRYPAALTAQMLTSFWSNVLKSSSKQSSLSLVTNNINAFLTEPVTPEIFQLGAHSLVYRAIAMFLAQHGEQFKQEESMLMAMEKMVFTGDPLILRPLAIRAMVALASKERSENLLEQLNLNIHAI